MVLMHYFSPKTVFLFKDQSLALSSLHLMLDSNPTRKIPTLYSVVVLKELCLVRGATSTRDSCLLWVDMKDPT